MVYQLHVTIVSVLFIFKTQKHVLDMYKDYSLGYIYIIYIPYNIAKKNMCSNSTHMFHVNVYSL